MNNDYAMKTYLFNGEWVIKEEIQKQIQGVDGLKLDYDYIYYGKIFDGKNEKCILTDSEGNLCLIAYKLLGDGRVLLRRPVGDKVISIYMHREDFRKTYVQKKY